jgi:hypothetical protein
MLNPNYFKNKWMTRKSNKITKTSLKISSSSLGEVNSIKIDDNDDYEDQELILANAKDLIDKSSEKNQKVGEDEDDSPDIIYGIDDSLLALKNFHESIMPKKKRKKSLKSSEILLQQQQQQQQQVMPLEFDESMFDVLNKKSVEDSDLRNPFSPSVTSSVEKKSKKV